MRLLASHIHPSLDALDGKSHLYREAARGIVLSGERILLLHTERYDDYSLPGGGIDPGEAPVRGLVRELEEETGARGVRDVAAFGRYEEFRPWYKPEYDVLHMMSYCYTCRIDSELGSTRLESYEQDNGMRAIWVSIAQAIAHNEATMANSSKQGLSVARETFLLRRIARECLSANTAMVA